MRILIYSYNYYPEPIGIGPLMTELAEGLVTKGHQVRVVTAFPWYPTDGPFAEYMEQYKGKLYATHTWNGVTLQRCYVRTSKKRNLINRGIFELSFMVSSFLQALQEWRPDILLLTVPGLPVGIPASIVSKWFHCPVVLNLQDILPEAAVQVGLLQNKLAIKIFAALEKYNYWMAKRITVISPGFIDNLKGKGVDPRKLCLIYNWVDLDFIRPQPHAGNPLRLDTWRQTAQETTIMPLQHRFAAFVNCHFHPTPEFEANYSLKDKFIVLYSGNIGLTQPMEEVVKAAKLLEHIPAIHFVLVGPNKGLIKIWQWCQQYQVSNVTLSPFVRREELPTLLTLANASLVVQKRNVISFNMPSKIQTISASGRPIIASVPDDGTAAQAIRDSGGGMLVAPEDAAALAQAIEHLYTRPEKVQRLGQQARQYAEQHYSFSSALESYDALFQELTNRKRSSVPQSKPPLNPPPSPTDRERSSVPNTQTPLNSPPSSKANPG